MNGPSRHSICSSFYQIQLLLGNSLIFLEKRAGDLGALYLLEGMESQIRRLALKIVV